MKKLLFTAALSLAILGVTATEADALGCGLFNRSAGERRFTPVRTTVNVARNITTRAVETTNRVVNTVLPRRAERVAARQATLNYAFDGTVETATTTSGTVTMKVVSAPVQEMSCSYGFTGGR